MPLGGFVDCRMSHRCATVVALVGGVVAHCFFCAVVRRLRVMLLCVVLAWLLLLLLLLLLLPRLVVSN